MVGRCAVAPAAAARCRCSVQGAGPWRGCCRCSLRSSPADHGKAAGAVAEQHARGLPRSHAGQPRSHAATGNAVRGAKHNKNALTPSVFKIVCVS
jgi:hypothetical protein